MKLTKIDKVFSLLVRLLAGRRCERCGTVYPEGKRGLHCSHYMGRTNYSTRWLVDNCDALCYGCHAYFEDRKQTEYRDWKIKKHGLEHVQRIENKSREIKKWTPKEKEQLYKDIKESLALLEKEPMASMDMLVGDNLTLQ